MKAILFIFPFYKYMYSTVNADPNPSRVASPRGFIAGKSDVDNL